MNSRFIGKDPGTGKDGRQKEMRVAEDEMVRQHHQLNRHEFQQTLGDSGDREPWRATIHEVAKSWT